MINLSIVVPCYNEEEILFDSYQRLSAILDSLIASNKIDSNSSIYFVDDGSKDKTWQLIEECAKQHKNARGIKLAHNVGHQKALLAGLFTAEGDALISIDADLQDDISVIPEMVDSFLSGNDIVLGVRNSRETDSKFKKITAEAFYSIMNKLGVEIVYNHADFRLMSRRSIEALKEYKEVNLFLRALVPMLGFSVDQVYYSRKERLAGISKYPTRRMLSFAWDGITSFSVTPLRLITMLGVFMAFLSFMYALYVFYGALFHNNLVQGWASNIILVLCLGGVQLICLGIVGEYIGKIYKEIKKRPRYCIDTTTYENR